MGTWPTVTWEFLGLISSWYYRFILLFNERLIFNLFSLLMEVNIRGFYTCIWQEMRRMEHCLNTYVVYIQSAKWSVIWFWRLNSRNKYYWFKVFSMKDWYLTYFRYWSKEILEAFIPAFGKRWDIWNTVYRCLAKYSILNFLNTIYRNQLDQMMSKHFSHRIYRIAIISMIFCDIIEVWIIVDTVYRLTTVFIYNT